MPETKESIQKEFANWEINRMQAIEALQEIGLSSREAESLVEDWESIGEEKHA